MQEGGSIQAKPHDQAPANGAKPFLRWPGGKRWLVEARPELFEVAHGTYFEPFVGSGSAFFHQSPEFAVLSDCNSELIATYQAIKNAPDEVYQILDNHAQQHSKEYYYDVRSRQVNSLSHRAARLLYLNRACFNGIYRVNREGRFNVPIGNTRNLPGTINELRAVSNCLQSADLFDCDFSETLRLIGPNDFVYLDPPYTVRHNNNGFIRYNEGIFTWDDQLRLAAYAEGAVRKGARVVVSNADHTSIVDLYRESGLFEITRVSRFSGVAAQRENRSTISELVILSRSI